MSRLVGTAHQGSMQLDGSLWKPGRDNGVGLGLGGVAGGVRELVRDKRDRPGRRHRRDKLQSI